MSDTVNNTQYDKGPTFLGRILKAKETYMFFLISRELSFWKYTPYLERLKTRPFQGFLGKIFSRQTAKHTPFAEKSGTRVLRPLVHSRGGGGYRRAPLPVPKAGLPFPDPPPTTITSGVDPFFGLGGGGGGGGQKLEKGPNKIGALRAQCRNVELCARSTPRRQN